MKACFTRSDGAASFAAALNERGFWLARGDRRGFVALDYKGNIYSLSRWLDLKPKALKARLGEPERLASVETTQAEMAASIGVALQRVTEEMERKQVEAMQPLLDQKHRIVARQRKERQELRDREARERSEQACVHAQQFRRGLKGLFDWITGRRTQMRRILEAEKEAAQRRWDAAFDTLRQRHVIERKRHQTKIDILRVRASEQRRLLERTICIDQNGPDKLLETPKIKAIEHEHEF